MKASILQEDSIVPNLCGGRWSRPAVEGWHSVHNPSTGEVIGQTPQCGAREVDAAVQAARAAFASWSQAPAPKRAEVLFRYRALLDAQSEALSRLVTRENGKTLDEAIQMMNRLPYGNGATLFTSSGHPARQFTRDMQCGMIGINVGVPAPMALFPFAGWNGSFYGDLHVQGMEGVHFYTRQKVVLSRWDSQYQCHQGW